MKKISIDLDDSDLFDSDNFIVDDYDYSDWKVNDIKEGEEWNGEECLDKLFKHFNLGKYESFKNMTNSERNEWLRDLKIKNILDE